jgi:hypothetical protein
MRRDGAQRRFQVVRLDPEIELQIGERAFRVRRVGGDARRSVGTAEAAPHHRNAEKTAMREVARLRQHLVGMGVGHVGLMAGLAVGDQRDRQAAFGLRRAHDDRLEAIGALRTRDGQEGRFLDQAVMRRARRGIGRRAGRLSWGLRHHGSRRQTEHHHNSKKVGNRESSLQLAHAMPPVGREHDQGSADALCWRSQ